MPPEPCFVPGRGSERLERKKRANPYMIQVSLQHLIEKYEDEPTKIASIRYRVYFPCVGAILVAACYESTSDGDSRLDEEFLVVNAGPCSS